MPVEENKELLRRATRARNASDLVGLLSIFPDEWHKGATAAFNTMTKAFPDLQLNIRKWQG